jgi:hypothetical protein
LGEGLIGIFFGKENMIVFVETEFNHLWSHVFFDDLFDGEIENVLQL